ncbi:MAG: preprotein translocase subunit SecA [Endomicrobium sp.]|jgi:preprotein translocase subunit SecA|nr:preprotein translocase subunit SecA [Endomicrobium sp.]
MFKTILRAIFGIQNEKNIKMIKPIIEKVTSLEFIMKQLSDKELKNKTTKFKERFSKGESLSTILPEAFACVREASIRTIGLRHFDVQIMGGCVLHNGKIAEMKTGEGKTLVATLAAYLNALTEKGVHIVTVNDYLAKRDKDWMCEIYKKLGLTVGCVVQGMSRQRRKEAYNCDITYVTNNELGFDYLRDNMVLSQNDKVLRSLNYAIIDEVDSILIDEARTPLIISGDIQKSADKYYTSNKIVSLLKGKKITEVEEVKAKYSNINLSNDCDYMIDEKNRSAVLTDKGTKKAEKILGIKNIYDDLESEWVHHLTQAIIANDLYNKNVDYVVKNGEVIIVDEFTGRLMPGRRWSDGLHQAIEAKENLKIAHENQTFATITFQNFFRMYKKISGMTGTAATERSEFWEIYKLNVIEIPTNNPMIRKDHHDVIYRTEKEKNIAIINEIESSWKKGQPVLVGTRSIEKSEKLSSILKKKNIPHNILNAKYHELEAKIISNAGMKYAITIATNMAGRGTDIILGKNSKETEEIKKCGGLYVIGTERHESRRIDNQLRGRAGRQGDPGETKFFISMEDELMRLFGSEKISIIMKKIGLKEGENIQHPWISKAVENAQKKVEGMNFDIRKHLIDFDNVMNKQRETIYKLRDEILNGDILNILKSMIKESINEKIDSFTSIKNEYLKNLRISNIKMWLIRVFDIKYEFENAIKKEFFDKEVMQKNIYEKIIEKYELKQKEVLPDYLFKIQKIMLLQMIDSSWIDHLYELDQLRRGIGFTAYAQKDPKIEYQKESFILFESMMKRIRENSIEYVFKTKLINKKYQEDENNKHLVINNSDIVQNNNVKLKNEKIGRNDFCPCKSNKKYKKCCGR